MQVSFGAIHSTLPISGTWFSSPSLTRELAIIWATLCTQPFRMFMYTQKVSSLQITHFLYIHKHKERVCTESGPNNVTQTCFTSQPSKSISFISLDFCDIFIINVCNLLMDLQILNSIFQKFFYLNSLSSPNLLKKVHIEEFRLDTS